jgi:hypothetical protein
VAIYYDVREITLKTLPLDSLFLCGENEITEIRGTRRDPME